jgi:hypothetical protein
MSVVWPPQLNIALLKAGNTDGHALEASLFNYCFKTLNDPEEQGKDSFRSIF